MGDQRGRNSPRIAATLGSEKASEALMEKAKDVSSFFVPSFILLSFSINVYISFIIFILSCYYICSFILFDIG